MQENGDKIVVIWLPQLSTSPPQTPYPKSENGVKQQECLNPNFLRVKLKYEKEKKSWFKVQYCNALKILILEKHFGTCKDKHRLYGVLYTASSSRKKYTVKNTLKMVIMHFKIEALFKIN